MLLPFRGALAIGACVEAASLYPRVNSSSPWYLDRFKSLITFGDSYTDESRLAYFIDHNGTAPPPGTLLPETFYAPSGGRTWPRYVIQYTGADVDGAFQPAITLYDYAVSGAVCSNQESPRFLSLINAPFPDLDGYEIPAFLADINSTRTNTTEPYFQPALTASNAVYVIFDGTNDIGVDAYFTDSQVPGNALTDYTACIYNQLDKLYAAGGRFFVLNTLLPLNLVPLYANDSSGGISAGPYWPDKPTNHTDIAERMREYVLLVNSIYKYQTPYEVLIRGRYAGANFAVFDTHGLIMDIYDNPTKYLNGSAPANVTSFENQCNVNGTDCVLPASPDSYLWFDALHPSEQTDRVIAREFVNVLAGNSSFASYY